MTPGPETIHHFAARGRSASAGTPYLQPRAHLLDAAPMVPKQRLGKFKALAEAGQQAAAAAPYQIIAEQVGRMAEPAQPPP